MAVTVTEDMAFRGEFLLRAAKCVISWFFRIPFCPLPEAQRAARTMVPSIHHKSLSISPMSTKAPRKRCAILLSVPSPFHLSNNVPTICHGPNSSGKSRHGEPVLKIQSIPSMVVRGSRRGRPVAFGLGKTSAIRFHSSSESQKRALFPSLP